MNKDSCKFKLVYGDDSLTDEEAKMIFRKSMIHLLSVFQKLHENSLVELEFRAADIISDTELWTLQKLKTEGNMEQTPWSIQLFHLIITRYNVQMAVNLLLNLNHTHLKSYRDEIHSVFNNIPELPKRLRVESCVVAENNVKYDKSITEQLVDKSSAENAVLLPKRKRVNVVVTPDSILKIFLISLIMIVFFLGYHFYLKKFVLHKPPVRVQMNHSLLVLDSTTQVFNVVLTGYDIKKVFIQRRQDLMTNKEIICKSKNKVTLEIDSVDADEWEGAKLDCGSNISGLELKGNQSIRSVYNLLYQASDVVELKILCNSYTPMWHACTNSNPSSLLLKKLRSMQFLSTIDDPGCNSFYFGLLDKFPKLHLKNFGLANVTIQNSHLITNIIYYMPAFSVLKLDTVKLVNVLELKPRLYQFEELQLKIKDPTLYKHIVDKTVSNFIKSTAYVGSFSCNVAQSESVLLELAHVSVHQLNMTLIVNRGIETLKLEFLSQFKSITSIHIRLTNWIRDLGKPSYLILEGFENLGQSIKHFEVTASFPIVTNAIPKCWSYQKSKNSDGAVSIKLKWCLHCGNECRNNET
ncbi:unnamed protein product [Orchesella dallaii]|uniref:Uncharacterized protein n=1 Tax=Orchesella dallaii TaxID=48710 RepID=A0ABP1PTB7_9HEXA